MVGSFIDDGRRLAISNEMINAIQMQIEEGMERTGRLLILIGRDFRFRYVSPPAAKLLGREPEEILGRKVEDLGIPGPLCDEFRELMYTVLKENRTVSGTHVHGSQLLVYDATPILKGGSEPLAVLFMVHDRTEQVLEHKALEAIGRINDLLRSSVDPQELVNSTVSAVAGTLDEDGFALVVNRGGQWSADHSMDLTGVEEMEVGAEALRLAGLAIDSKQPMVIRNASEDERVTREVASRYGIGPMLVLPVKIREGTNAVLIFARFKMRPFNSYELSLANKIATSIAVAINDQLMLQELKRADEERECLLTSIAQESERLTSILEATPISIGLFESDGKEPRLTMCNEIFRHRTLSSVPGPLEGKRFADLAAPEEVAVAVKMVERAFMTGRTQVRQDHVHTAKERTYPAQLMITPISEDPPSFLVVGVDTSELMDAKKQVEEYTAKVEAERVRLRTIVDNLPVGVILVDHDGRVIESNDPRADAWAGKNPRSESASRPLRAKRSNDGIPVTKDGMPITRAIKYGEVVKGEMFDVVRDGRQCTELISAAPIHDGKGKRIGAVAILQDLTDQRQLEMEAVEAKERAEMYLDLLTHDIQGHNAAIAGYVQLAMGKDKAGKRKDDLQKAMESIAASTELIDNMRKLQLVELNDMSHNIVEISSMLDDVIASIRPLGGEGTTIERISPQKCFVMASSLLREAFCNILSTSIKHSDGHIHVSIRQNRVYDGGKEYHKFIIEDNGPGIPDDVKPRVFMRHFRGRTKSPGKGLGLYLAKRLIDEHGGRIWVEDRVPGDPSQGAKFIIHLPAVTSTTGAVDES